MMRTEPTMRALLGVCLAAGVLSAGCIKSMTPGRMQWVRTDSNMARAGNVYLLRGWIGVFSEGIDRLTRKLNDAGVRAHAYQDDQWQALARRLREEYRSDPDHEPLVLIGHSYGADDVVRVARKLNQDGIQIDLLVTIDPVTPPPVPSNVRRAVSIYQSNGVWDTMPWLRGVPVKKEPSAATQLANYDIRSDRTDLLEPGTDHFNIENKNAIHAEIIKHVLMACPSRPHWAAARGAAPQATPDRRVDEARDRVH